MYEQDREKIYRETYDAIPYVRWDIIDPDGPVRLGAYLTSKIKQPSEDDDTYFAFNIVMPTIKIYCAQCRNVEAYNFIGLYEVLHNQLSILENQPDQVFVFNYLCQSCKGTPEIFMVRKHELKLSITGRTPMEQVITPHFLPKGKKDYYSDALIAYNAGQFLPGVFMLRTFIEQYLRSQSATPNADKMDILFAEYGEKLPQDFKNRFPSLKDVYDSLSTIIHMGDRSERADAVFQKSKQDIEKHFNAKHIFEIEN